MFFMSHDLPEGYLGWGVPEAGGICHQDNYNVTSVYIIGSYPASSWYNRYSGELEEGQTVQTLLVARETGLQNCGKQR